MVNLETIHWLDMWIRCCDTICNCANAYMVWVFTRLSNGIPSPRLVGINDIIIWYAWTRDIKNDREA